MFVVLLLVHLLFIWFFWKIGFSWWMYIIGFIFFLLFILFFFTEEWKSTWKKFLKEFILTYLSYINIVLIMLWVFFISKYFLISYGFSQETLINLSALMVVLGFLMIFLFLWVLIKNHLWIKLAYFWFFLTWWYISYLVWDLKVFNFFVWFLLAITVVSHLLYFVRFQTTYKFFLYVLLIFGLIGFFLIVKNFITSPIVFSNFVQLVILLILSWILLIKSFFNKILKIEEKIKSYQNDLKMYWYSDIEISKQEKFFYEKWAKYKALISSLLNFFDTSPLLVKILFSLTNTVPLIFASYYFFANLDSSDYIKNNIFYWIWAILFFVNFLLFKKLNWFVVIQRVFAFFVISFVVYFTLFNFFGYNYMYIAIWWIIWNLLSTVIILFIWKYKIFDAVDYLNWTVVNFLWLFVNIFLLLKIPVNFYFKLWVIFLYFWAYLYLYRIIYKKLNFSN